MPVLDTNCVVRWLVPDDEEKTNLVEALLAHQAPLRVSDVVMAEVIHVLESYYQFEREEVAQAVQTIAGCAAFDLDRTLWDAVAVTSLSHPKLSLIDIFLALDTDRHHDGPLYSFDRKLVSQLDAVSP